MNPGTRLWRTSGPALIFGALVLTTIGAVYAVYGNVYFPRWPWFRAAVILSLVTCLWPFALRRGKGLGLLESVVCAGLILCFAIFLIYPGSKALGLRSDFRLLPLWNVLSVLHGFGVHLMFRWIGDGGEPGQVTPKG